MIRRSGRFLSMPVEEWSPRIKLMNKYLHIIKVCLKDKIMIRDGRADRLEFLVFNIFAVVVYGLIYLTRTTLFNIGVTSQVSMAINMILVAIQFVFFLAQYTSIMRRLHDTNRSGVHLVPILLGFVVAFLGIWYAQKMLMYGGLALAIAGVVYIIMLCLLKGTPSDNQYGSPVSSEQRQ